MSTARSTAASTSRKTRASISAAACWCRPTIPAARICRPGFAKLPIFTTFGGSAGLGQRFNRFDLSIKGDAERTVYQESTLTDGSDRQQ